MLRTILLSSVALLPVAAAPAFAACATNSPTTGAIIACEGVDLSGLQNSNANSVQLTVGSGASVSNSNDSTKHVVHLRNDATITVRGTISSLSDRDAINLKHRGTVNLIGATLSSVTGDGIQVEDTPNLTIDAASSVTVGKKGVNGGDGNGGTVTNYGQISAGTEGVELGNDAAVYNYGSILADDDGINIGEGAYILNAGVIHSRLDGKGEDFVQDGIDLDSGIIDNHGQILSDDDAAIDFDATTRLDVASVITNRGVIRGAAGIIVETGFDASGAPNSEVANTGRQEVYNLNGALIEGTAGTALNLGAGDDLVENAAGATIAGDVYLGTGNDSFTASTGSVVYGDVFLDAGDDLLTITDTFFSTPIAGTFGLFDGGEGTDTLSLLGYLWADLGAFSWSDATSLDLSFLDGFTLSLTNFESLSFADVSFANISDLTLADLPAVPLPAPALMLLSALGGFGLLRRARKKTA